MLSQTDLADIKELLASGVSHAVVALKYDLERETVRRLNKQFKKDSYAAS